MNTRDKLVRALAHNKNELIKRVKPPAGSLPVNPISERVKDLVKKPAGKVK